MKTNFLVLFIFIISQIRGQSSELIYVPKQNSLVASYDLVYSPLGFYVGGYLKTTFPYPYIYTTPMSRMNRLGISFNNGYYSIMAGGYIENFFDSIKIKTDIWFKIYPIRTITNKKEGLDFIFALNYMKEINYAIGIVIPFNGIYSRW